MNCAARSSMAHHTVMCVPHIPIRPYPSSPHRQLTGGTGLLQNPDSWPTSQSTAQHRPAGTVTVYRADVQALHRHRCADMQVSTCMKLAACVPLHAVQLLQRPSRARTVPGHLVSSCVAESCHSTLEGPCCRCRRHWPQPLLPADATWC